MMGVLCVHGMEGGSVRGTLACKILSQVLQPLSPGMGLVMERNTGLQANLGDGNIKHKILVCSLTHVVEH